jgi:hypothetical protein
MAKKPSTPAKTTPPAAAATDVVIRDESDEIIDGLRRQLDSLQQELSAYRRGGSAPPPAAPRRSPAPEVSDDIVRAWGSEFPPYLASRLQIPAEDLTQRLSRLIDQVGDPGLRRELEHCRDTASLLSNTFRRIQDNHRLLTESLIAEKMTLPVEEFFGQIQAALREGGYETPTIDGSRRGMQLTIAASAACAVVATLAELVTTLFGPPVLTRVDMTEVDAAGVFRLQIATPRPWQGVEGDQVSELVFRSGVRAHSIVDLLYVEKIAELQGASVRYLRENGVVHGLEVTWPSA